MSTYQIVRYYHERYDGVVRYAGKRVLKEVVNRQEALDYLNTPEASSTTCRQADNLEFESKYGPYIDVYEEVEAPPPDYSDEADDDAKETVRYFKDEIIEQLLEKGEASDDLLNDYTNGEAYHHESHVDKYYDLEDAASVLSQLSDHLETDSGLWDGLEPKEQIAALAAFTYGNAVYSGFQSLIESINDDQDIGDLVDVYNELDGIDEEDFEDEDGNVDDVSDMIEKAVKDAMGNIHKGEKTAEEGKAAVKSAIEARIEEIIA